MLNAKNVYEVLKIKTDKEIKEQLGQDFFDKLCLLSSQRQKPEAKRKQRPGSKWKALVHRRDLVKAMLNQGLSLRDMERELKKRGLKVSYVYLQRFIKNM